ncbi:hypothetical protein FRC05_000154 [Tulasnella sp. 425]|nr:hypothetical protein FRC05_000154 [Tulasnella sp. 425]
MDRDEPPAGKPQDDELPTYAAVEAEEPQAAARWNRWQPQNATQRIQAKLQDQVDGDHRFTFAQREDPYEDGPAPVGQSEGRPTTRRQHTQLNIAPPDYVPAEPPLPQGEACEPSRLCLHQFGSRFLPHATGRIHCMLPLMSDRFLLVGSTDGLSVVDVLPGLHPRKGDQALSMNPGLATQPLADAVAVPIWTGEAVYQLDLLEDVTSDMNPDSPQGVVLALVGPSDDECNKSIRMYNLASLASLVRWYCSQGDHPPLDMAKPGGPSMATIARARLRKSRRQSDIAKGIKALIVDDLKATSSSTPSALATPARRNDRSRSPANSPPTARGDSFRTTTPPPQSATSLFGTSSPIAPTHIPKSPSQTSIASSSWDIVDELPTRKLSTLEPPNYILSALHVDWGKAANFSSNSHQAKYIVDFYTPLAAKSISFTLQAGNKSSATEHARQPSGSSSGALRKNRSVDYGTQACLFVAFEKKAGLIRIGDSAVIEVESFPDIGATISTSTSGHRTRPSVEGGMSLSSGPVRRHLAASLDGSAFWKSHPPWLGLVELQLPPLAVSAAHMMSADDSRAPSLPGSICFITRGRTTQIYPVPLPMSFNNTALSTAPLKTLTWRQQATKIHARLSLQRDGPNATPESARGGPPAPVLQVVGLGQDGVEIQEFSLEFLLKKQDAKDKGKARATFDSDPVVRAFADVGGAAGFLCVGGQWNKPMSRITSPVGDIRGVLNSPLTRQDTWASVDTYGAGTVSSPVEMASVSSHVTLSSGTIYESGGLYGWVSKGGEDYRVFWLGERAEK